MNAATNKQEALTEIATLARRFSVSAHEIAGCIDRPDAENKIQNQAQNQERKWLTQLLGYLGAVFVFGGLGLFIGMRWDELGSAARVIITYGPGLATFILALIGITDPRFQKTSTPLFLVSAVLQPTGIFVFLHEYVHGDDAQLGALLVFGVMSFQFLSAYVKHSKTTLLFFGYLFWNAAIGIFMDRAGIPGNVIGVVLGLSIMVAAWEMDKTRHRPIAGFWYFLGSAGLLWSTFDVLDRTAFDVCYLAIAGLIMYLSVRVRSRTLLMTSSVALLGFLGYFTWQHFAHTIGWPIALMLIGFILIGVSYFAVTLNKKIQLAAH